MKSALPLVYCLLLLPRLWLAAKALRVPLPAARALLLGLASVALTLLAGGLLIRFTPALAYVGVAFYMYSLQAPGPAPLAGLLVLALSALPALLPGVLLECAFLRRQAGLPGTFTVGLLALAGSALLFAATVALSFSLQASATAAHGSTYLDPQWRSCSSDADCVAVRFGCESFMGGNREHEEETKAAVYAMSGDPARMRCAPPRVKVAARCLDRRCDVVTLP